jgi:hypothetical protein
MDDAEVHKAPEEPFSEIWNHIGLGCTAFGKFLPFTRSSILINKALHLYYTNFTPPFSNSSSKTFQALPFCSARSFFNMSEGDVQPPKAPVVAEAHEVDTYHGKFFRLRSNMAMTRANSSVVPKAFFEYATAF